MINKMNRNHMHQALLVAKVFVFIYILISPLINHKKYIPFMNALLAKTIFVIIIAIVGFIDLQLAILLAIALFVLIINFNKDKISISNFTPMTASAVTPLDIKKNDNPPYMGETIHDVSDVNAMCNAKPFEDTQISDDLMTHFIDERTKPYETYIRQLTNGNYLIDVQTNSFIK